MRKCKLKNTNFSRSNFSLSNFSDTTIENTILKNTNFESANFNGAYFNNVDITSADLNTTMLNHTRFDRTAMTHRQFEHMKKFNLKISAYYNDSPFSSHLSKKLYYQNQKNAYLKYDNLFVYRDDDYKQLINQYGINESLIYLVPPSCPEKEFLNCIPITNNFLYDFAFVGHYEPD